MIIICCSLCSMVLGLISLVCIFSSKKRQKKNNKESTIILDKIKEFNNRVKQEVEDIDLKPFIVVSKKDVHLNFMHDEYDFSTTQEEQKEYAIKKYNEWKDLIERHSQYIVNCLISNILEETNKNGPTFWNGFLRNASDMGNEKCLQMFQNIYTDEFKHQLEPYFKKETSLNMVEVFKTHFSFFDYDEIQKSCWVEIYLHENTFVLRAETIEIVGYIEFDSELNICSQDSYNT